MPLTRLHTWIAGEVLTASDLNAEFNNIIDNLQVAVTGTMGDGTVTSPGLQFFSDGDTGLYKVGANALGVAAGGIHVFVASEYFQASAFRFPVKVATESVFTAQPGRAYWQSAEGSVHIHTGTAIARMPAIVGLQAGDFIAATNPSGVQGATVYARGKFSTGTAVSAGGEVTVTPSTLAVTASTSQVFTSGTAATYTTPANVRYIEIEMVGGGGGGCGGSTGTAGTAGTATTFSGGSLSAGGGGAGQSNAASDASGAATGGNILNLSGARGAAPGGTPSGANQSGGSGAGSVFGGAGPNNSSGATAGVDGIANTGGGGGGGSTNDTEVAGGGGGAGSYVRHRIASPAATYTYTVGPGGGGGAGGGAAGGAGGSGGAGIIIITEHYI